MNKFVAAVCAVVIIIALQSEKCLSLEYILENIDNENELSEESFSKYDIPDSYETKNEQMKTIHPVFYQLFSTNKKEGALDEIAAATNRRVVRQAYQGQTPLYPNLPSGSPYGLQPYPNNNNQNPSQNQQWQHSYNNNNSQSGYPSPTHGYQPNYNNNNHQGATQLPNTHPAYPNSNGYNSYPSGAHGQNPQNNQWQPQHRPYNSSNGNNSFYNNSSNPYSGYKPANSYNNPSSRPPYNQFGQHQNNSYSGPSATSGYRPVSTPSPYPYNSSQRPQYYPGQSPINNTGYPQVVPGNQHPVTYDNSIKSPGQNPYGGYNNGSIRFENTLNNTQGRTPYNYPNGQNPQSFNSYPGTPGYGSQNSSNPYNVPNQYPRPSDTNSGQHASNNYPGYTPGSANRYNQNSPNGNIHPYSNGPYGNGSPPNHYQQYPNGAIDPTKVSPGHFNSY